MNPLPEHMSKPFEGFHHGTSQINLKPYLPEKATVVAELRPIQIHCKADGDINNKPSFCIVMSDNTTHCVYGQISLKMLNQGLKDIGYEIKAIKP